MFTEAIWNTVKKTFSFLPKLLRNIQYQIQTCLPGLEISVCQFTVAEEGKGGLKEAWTQLQEIYFLGKYCPFYFKKTGYCGLWGKDAIIVIEV